MNVSRVRALVVLLVLATGAVLFAADPEPRGVSVELPTALAEVSMGGASGDLWFCLGPTADLDGVAERVVTLVSYSSEDVEGRVTVADDTGRVVERSVTVTAGSHLDVRPGRYVPEATWVGVTVEMPGGQVIVEDAIFGSEMNGGLDDGACTTVTSASWQVPWATTSRPGNRAVLLLYNPFRAPAVADLRFIGDIGRRETLDSQGIVVNGRSVSVFDLTERIADSAVVSATVDVRVGQLVVARLQIADGTDLTGVRGLDLAYGVSRTSSRLLFPGVPVQSGGSLVVLNPGDDYVEAEVLILPEDPGVFVEPKRVVLRGRQRQVVEFDPGLARTIGSYGLEVRSLDGQPLAASLVDRTVANKSLEEGEPNSDSGLTTLSSTDVGATRWRFRLISDPIFLQVLNVVNPATDTISRVRFENISGEPIAWLPEEVEIQPATQVRFVVSSETDVTIDIDSDAAVVAGLYGAAGSGRTWIDGVVIAGTASILGS